MKSYKRILLKLTGEVLGGEKEIFDFNKIERIAYLLKRVSKENGVQIAIVLGGGNIFRGREVEKTSVDRATADYIGMIGTVMNALALQEALERQGCPVRVMSSIQMEQVCERYLRRRAISHLEKGRVVILAGGVGSPFFTTDTAAALRACELNCDVILKASNVDGIYDSDPKLNKKAKIFKKLNYQEALEMRLEVMDNTAFALCQRELMPIIVFSIEKIEKLDKIINGKRIGTIVSNNI